MEDNTKSPSNHIASSSARSGRYTPTCPLCGLEHWPRDPVCLGKKGYKAKKKTKSKHLARLREESQAAAEQTAPKPIESVVKPQASVMSFTTPDIPAVRQAPAQNISQPKDEKVVRIKAKSPQEISTFNAEIKKIRDQADQVVKNAAKSAEMQIQTERSARLAAEEQIKEQQRLRLESEKKLSAEIKRMTALQEKSREQIQIYADELNSLKSQITTEKPVSVLKKQIPPAKSPGNTSSLRIVPSRTASNVGALLAIRACEIMEKNIVWAAPDDTIATVLDQMLTGNSYYALVCQDNKVEGIVSRIDLSGPVSSYLQPFAVRWQKDDFDAAFNVEIKWIMSRQINSITPDATCTTIMKAMRKLNMCPLPVIDSGGKPLGIVSPYNVFKIRALIKLESQNSIPIAQQKIKRLPARINSYLSELNSSQKNQRLTSK